MNEPRSSSINRLLEFRELKFESCIKVGVVPLQTLLEYKDLAEKSVLENPLARVLPSFSMSLLDSDGSFGAVEFAVKNELVTQSDLSIDKEA